jgi:hypothetical protein
MQHTFGAWRQAQLNHLPSWRTGQVHGHSVDTLAGTLSTHKPDKAFYAFETQGYGVRISSADTDSQRKSCSWTRAACPARPNYEVVGPNYRGQFGCEPVLSRDCIAYSQSMVDTAASMTFCADSSVTLSPSLKRRRARCFKAPGSQPPSKAINHPIAVSMKYS